MQGDANRLQQVFINIIDNAVKYNRRGGYVEIKAEAIPPDELKITVEDNGRGIPAEHMPHIKEKFYKTDPRMRGSGIGLSVADKIIHLHGGRLDIESAEGAGTRVIITLPVERICVQENFMEIKQHLEEERGEEQN
jgi:signal transduction histidine kinase